MGVGEVVCDMAAGPCEGLSTDAIRAALLALAEARGEKTFCPSEAARRVAVEWRGAMDAVREEAARLQADGLLQATQKGQPVDPLLARGPIRLGRPRD